MKQYSSAIKAIATNHKKVKNTIFANSWTCETSLSLDECLAQSRAGPVQSVQELRSLKINKSQVARAICVVWNIAILSSENCRKYVEIAKKLVSFRLNS